MVYCDFETTAPTDSCLDSESKKMFAVPYVIIFAFQPKLNIDRVTIERSFGHSFQKLTDIGYLTTDQLLFANSGRALQLKYVLKYFGLPCLKCF